MRIGDYVRAACCDPTFGDVSGIYLGPRRAGQIELKGERDYYICFLEGAVVVPDSNLWGDTREFVMQWRVQNGTTGSTKGA